MITLSIALMGRVSPGPMAVPYRHAAAHAAFIEQPSVVAVVTTVAPKQATDPAAFSKPVDLDWQAEWTRTMAGKAFDTINLHAKNAPFAWNVDVSPALVKGGGAVLVLKVAY